MKNGIQYLHPNTLYNKPSSPPGDQLYPDNVCCDRPIFSHHEPNVLKSLLIIPSSTSQKSYPLFLLYSRIITHYTHIILLHRAVARSSQLVRPS